MLLPAARSQKLLGKGNMQSEGSNGSHELRFRGDGGTGEGAAAARAAQSSTVAARYMVAFRVPPVLPATHGCAFIRGAYTLQPRY